MPNKLCALNNDMCLITRFYGMSQLLHSVMTWKICSNQSWNYNQLSMGQRLYLSPRYLHSLGLRNKDNYGPSSMYPCNWWLYIETPSKYWMSTPASTPVIYTYQKYGCVLSCVILTLCLSTHEDDADIYLVYTYNHLTKCSLYSHTSNTPTGRSSSLLVC